MKSLFLEHKLPNGTTETWDVDANDPEDVAAMAELGWQRIPGATTIGKAGLEAMLDAVAPGWEERRATERTDPDATDDPDDDARELATRYVPKAGDRVRVLRCSKQYEYGTPAPHCVRVDDIVTYLSFQNGIHVVERDRFSTALDAGPDAEFELVSPAEQPPASAFGHTQAGAPVISQGNGSVTKPCAVHAEPNANCSMCDAWWKRAERPGLYPSHRIRELQEFFGAQGRSADSNTLAIVGSYLDERFGRA